MKTQYFPESGVVIVAEWLAEDGTPMKANLSEIRVSRPDGTRGSIPPYTGTDGSSSPIYPKRARFAAWFHDWAFRYCLGWWVANIHFYLDMRQADKRGRIMAGLFWLALTLWPFAYIQHMIRRRTGYGSEVEKRWEMPDAVWGEAEKVFTRMQQERIERNARNTP